MCPEKKGVPLSGRVNRKGAGLGEPGNEKGDNQRKMCLFQPTVGFLRYEDPKTITKDCCLTFLLQS